MATIDLKTLLGMAIKTQRTSLGISQEELAHRADLHTRSNLTSEGMLAFPP
jgi:transcriptional regulator with XRE-family HTH domain